VNIAERVAEGRAARATFRDVFAVGEFRALWTAQMLSMAGDQLARVALTVLVFERTRSALLAAVTFVCSIIPTFVGGVALAGIADRVPRRQVMIVCDLIRLVLVLVMALPSMPLVVLVVLLFLVTFVSAPFTSARSAIYPDVLTGDRYVLGTAVTQTTSQFAQVIGFAVGGIIAGKFGVRTSLVADAVTFAGSALIVWAWVQARPAPPPSAAPRRGHRKPTFSSNIAAGARLVFATPALLLPMLFGWLSAFYNTPEGVATPLAKELGGGATTVGIVLAAQALGETLGAIAFSRFVKPSTRLRLMGPLAMASPAVLLLFAFRPALLLSLLVLVASGVFACYQLAANAAFVQATPPEQRSQAFGLALGGMSLGQGALMILAGAAAGRYAPALVIAVFGAAGVVSAAAVAVTWSRTQPRPRHARIVKSRHARTVKDHLSGPGAVSHNEQPPLMRMVLLASSSVFLRLTPRCRLAWLLTSFASSD
jgi:MFS family permease